MSFELVYTYPVWFIPLCFLVGLLYAFLLYRKNNGFAEVSKWIVRLLFALRALAITILCFLLFAPLLRLNSREVEKPIILFVQDNSESIVKTKDSSFYRNEYPELLNELSDKLSEKFDFKQFSFSAEVQDSFQLDFKGKETDISNALNTVYDLNENLNIGAVILASDGIYNKGTNPLYLNRGINAPVYTIALGDTTLQRDILIKQVQQNQLAYLNNTFPVNVVVQANKLKGSKSRVTIRKGNETLAQQDITVNDDAYLNTFSFQLKANQVGIQKLNIAIQRIEGEFTYDNNIKDIFIEVIDSRQKVLILASAPHPDIAAIKQSLESNQNYEVKVSTTENLKESIKGFSLIILHQIPSISNGFSKYHQEALQADIPIWYIVGANTITGALNTQQKLLQINNAKGQMNDVYPFINKDFALFTLSDQLLGAIAKWGPLQIPYGSYTAQASSIALLYQRIGSVTTKYPLFIFSSDAEQKSAVLAGEGVWRWRLQNFAENGDHLLFDELISKTVQYLSVRNDRKNLRVISKNSYNDNERIRIDAEVYNSSYELINTVDVNLELQDEDGNKYPFSFARTTSAYTLDLGLLKAGNYTYKSTTQVGEDDYFAQGKFIIKEVTAERSSGRADHSLLNTLAMRSGGSMIQPSELLNLDELLSNRNDVKPISHVETKLEELIKFSWIFGLILLLLSLEWFLRKRNGSY